jgi:frataxin-like iron-binding protein CyaY
LDVILEHREERFIELRDQLCAKIAEQLDAQREVQ